MRQLLTLTLLTILGAVAVRTQDDKPNPYLTNGESNGVMWRGLDESHRVSYVDGASDGFYHGFWYRRLGVEPNSIPVWFASKATIGEIMKEIDAFYQDGANISLPMITAFEYSEMKLAGATKRQLDQFLTIHR